MTVKELVKKEPQGQIAKAYKFAEIAHAKQKRRTGEPYFVHVLATAEILNSWHLDEATIVAGLLHDTIEDTGISSETITQEFGDQVTFLVNGVTKLGKIKYRGAEAEAKAENLRKMILAISEDLRVVFIKLADRLHNMRTLSALPPQKQRRIALETHEIYAPLAYRLGMQNISGELQDLAFPYLYPEEYRWLRAQVAEAYEARLKYLEKLKPVVQKALEEKGIRSAIIDFRAKRYSSLYKKLLRQSMDVENIYDLVAMRIILKNQEACYGALGIIHSMWPPLPGRIKDYIAMPKPNGYRSLHTTIIGPEKKIVEFQIRTEEMHDEAEHGIAAHWIYKAHGGANPTQQKRVFDEAKWVEQLKRWQEHHADTNPDEFLESLKVDFFKDRIFVITPRGEVLDLPVGSTPVDFAYEIHSEVGDTAVGAKVNNQIVPLSHELHSGDFVEILTQKNKKPSEDWLTFIKTSNAKDHVRASLRKKQTGLRKTAPLKSEIKMVIKDRVGLIKDIAVVIARLHINLEGLTTSLVPGGNFQSIKAVCDTADKQKIERLILKLKTIKEVKEISYRLLERQAA